LPHLAERMLPPDLLARATLRGNEYAWPLDDVSRVIHAARKTNLVNLGGELQFRFPDLGTFECHWVEVETHNSASSSLPWPERVALSADAALRDFAELRRTVDFLKAGQDGFPNQFAEATANGLNPEQFMCFVWYLQTEEESLAGSW
jgi:hypothetical protein